MQRPLFLTSNLSGIWHHGEFGNKRVSNKGISVLTGAWLSVWRRLLLVSALIFFPFSLQHKDRSQRKKNLSSTLYITQSGTANYISSLWEEILFIGLCGPILYLLIVFVCQLLQTRRPLPYPSRRFSVRSSTTLPKSPFQPSQFHSKQPSVCLSRSQTVRPLYHTQI